MSSPTENVSVPQASPESNAGQAAPSKSTSRNRKMMMAAGLVLLVVVATIAIAVPLSKRGDDKDSSTKLVSQSAVAELILDDNEEQCHEPKEGDSCTTQQSYEQCLGLARGGCKKIYSTFSCPPIHRCGDKIEDEDEDEDDEGPVVPCTMEVKTCPDGTSVGRSGPNCEFEECPPPMVACTMEVLACSDGSFVGRSGPNCEFEECPEGSTLEIPEEKFECPKPVEGDSCNTEESYQECLSLVNSGCQKIYSTFSCPPMHRCGDEPAQQNQGQPPAVACTMEVQECPDGSFVGRSGPNCEFEECPTMVACTMEVQECPDGSFVGRSGPNCEFEECPPMVACTMEVQECPDGSFVGRSGPNCEFEECPPMVACTMEVQECPDGSFVGRSGPSCEFEECPPPMVACTMEVLACSDGSFVGRSGPNCDFEECPEGSTLELPEEEFECPQPVEGDDCISEESYEQCMTLKESGCKMIMSTFSCPPLHRCGDQPNQATEESRSESEPALIACPMDVKGCADGSFVDREGPNCEFKKCPEELNLRCSRELALCADGTTVGRAPPACTFEACPDGACPIDTFDCSNGVVLKRDPNMYCEFPACPSL